MKLLMHKAWSEKNAMEPGVGGEFWYAHKPHVFEGWYLLGWIPLYVRRVG